MGVLMSKRQQVEKVQKCSVVVSAFKEGLKDRPPPANPPEESADPDGKPAETEAAAPTNEEEKEVGHKEEDGKAGASTSQHASAQHKEDCRINQEAWSRLRDGKGVEPEDLEKANQLTPPAFIRPKRDINDDQPVEIELGQREQPVNDEMCEICEVWTADDLFPCRTCTRVFHDGCLREMGYLSTDTLQEMRDTAHTATGWSCYYCDNINLLLTEEEMYSLMETFKQCKIIPESCLVADEVLQYKHFLSKRLFEKDLSDEQEEEVLAQFSALDPEKRGQIEWSDFLYHESLGVLSKFRSENSLVRLLTAKERDRARSVFLSLDQDNDGLITGGDVRRAQQSWFRKHSKESQSCNVSISHVGPISENSPSSSSSEKSRERDDNRQVTWPQFLKESALYILAARPNSAAMHLRPLL
ncbi:PHD finger protein 24-like [Megalops cyprinoides]|uniref:PHD finger protein 24-like n=1 Tax=Megalops cyprinoides TaxID=118141 RepID=UPI0018645CCF|nr:PHD finger protein 24-like [Megalops cyprinoides]XP_036383553.1 PHD finger protein 24-like [Megalops cyprinoides]